MIILFIVGNGNADKHDQIWLKLMAAIQERKHPDKSFLSSKTSDKDSPKAASPYLQLAKGSKHHTYQGPENSLFDQHRAPCIKAKTVKHVVSFVQSS